VIATPGRLMISGATPGMLMISGSYSRCSLGWPMIATPDKQIVIMQQAYGQ
jgi:hypothetical protein